MVLPQLMTDCIISGKTSDYRKNFDGFTPEQRFFISWATIWRTKSRDEYVKNR
ncbi:M13-type metalloendopeptidase [Myroides ceti]|uniref:M13-type metalloendopeptidase n=1 Tax=Paenimyroides ceti TaxID=395087 RepID=A0ABT8D249_9FLAO|nr:M13-type metalloendopeptidase [Paenimyroides ceti]MDN3710549.1 M13-type metalloendopeptidase [Paenimyroides ceti]